jgi:hypothetical protein
MRHTGTSDLTSVRRTQGPFMARHPGLWLVALAP